jgi:hypothetical protein
MGTNMPMTPEEVLLRMMEALVELTGDEEFKTPGPDDPLHESLGSMVHFSYLLALEKEFELKIPDHLFKLRRLGTIADIQTVILQCLEGDQSE